MMIFRFKIGMVNLKALAAGIFDKKKNDNVFFCNSTILYAPMYYNTYIYEGKSIMNV